MQAKHHLNFLLPEIATQQSTILDRNILSGSQICRTQLCVSRVASHTLFLLLAMSQTQPSTQQVLDPRRLGRNNSGLNDGDIADVLVILHPATPTAIKIVENTAESRPQHVLFRNSLDPDSMNASLTDIEEQETIIINGAGERVGQSSRAGADLALRMSAARSLRFKELGFIFGRNPNSADIVFGQDSGKRISNQHFRIYLNLDGVLMIEDLSTNGTIVDDLLLKNKDKRFSRIRMIGSGSIICIQSSNDAEMIKFVVRVPSRVSHLERFRENLANFIADCAKGDDKTKGESMPIILQSTTNTTQLCSALARTMVDPQ